MDIIDYPTNGKTKMKTTKRQLKRIIKEEYSRILSEEEERAVFDPEAVDLPIPKALVKLLDPDITPQKFAQLDGQLDAKGSPQQQAFACAAYAMTYADNDIDGATKILKLAIGLMPKIKKGIEKAKE